MRYSYLLLIPAIVLASCGGKTQTGKNDAELAKLKKQRAELDEKIKGLEGKGSDSTKKATPVTLQEVQPTDFTAYVQVQSQITGDQNVYASPQGSGVVKNVNAHVGQHVSKGQVLATLDAAAVEQQIQGQEAQLTLTKALYEKQQALWKQNIGTQVQLLSAKANYESSLKQRDALVAQRNMYRVVAPITGTIDQMNLKEGDVAMPGMQAIRVVNLDKMKADANLGESYLGKVHTGNSVILVFPDIHDSIKTNLTYVAESVDPVSRAFNVQVRLNNNSKLHPNMSCIMKIANYENGHAIVVPVSVIQKTGKGDMVFVADGNTAKAVQVTTGQNSNGIVEILSGLSAGDKVITAGFEDLDNGDPISAQQQ
jgi:RND family efflux transporter MFP subunit